MFTGYNTKKRVNERYRIIGFISSGTYGRVYKAESRNPHPTNPKLFAIKKFKPDKEGELQYSGISQSAIREMALSSPTQTSCTPLRSSSKRSASSLSSSTRSTTYCRLSIITTPVVKADDKQFLPEPSRASCGNYCR
jgi:hypothetical protein